MTQYYKSLPLEEMRLDKVDIPIEKEYYHCENCNIKFPSIDERHGMCKECNENNGFCYECDANSDKVYGIEPNYTIRNLDSKNKDTFHFRGIEAYKINASTYKGERVAIYDTRHNKRIYISWDYRISDLKTIAMNELERRNIKIDGFTYNEKTYKYTLLTRDFETELTK